LACGEKAKLFLSRERFRVNSFTRKRSRLSAKLRAASLQRTKSKESQMGPRGEKTVTRDKAELYLSSLWLFLLFAFLTFYIIFYVYEVLIYYFAF
jgi:hypothetical protein